jgi:beta-carotene 3-hydroxylase
MIDILLAIGAFAFMEFVAWSNHKYVMHGFLWKWHKDHHINDHKKANENLTYQPGLEKNDYFFLVYAAPALLLLLFGFWFQISELIAVGIGISLYGLAYFIIHDIIIHERLNIPFLLKLKTNPFMQAVTRAHMAHHRGKNVRDFDNYGLLVFQFRFFKNKN